MWEREQGLWDGSDFWREENKRKKQRKIQKGVAVIV